MVEGTGEIGISGVVERVKDIGKRVVAAFRKPPDESMSPIDSPSSLKALGQETIRLERATKKAGDELPKTMISTPGEFLRSSDLEAEFWETQKYTSGLQDEVDMQQADINTILEMGGYIHMNDLLNQRLTFTRSHGVEAGERPMPYFALMGHRHAGAALIKIGGITPLDIANDARSKSLSVSNIFRFYVNSLSMLGGVSDHLVLGENTEFPKKEFPHFTRVAINDAVIGIYDSMQVSEQDLDEYIAKNKGVARKAAQCARRFIKNGKVARMRSQAAFFDPNSQSFSEMTEVVLTYLQGQKDAPDDVLYALGIERVKDIRDAYRGASQLSSSSAAHGLVTDALSNLLKEYPASALPTYEQVPALILNEEDNEYPVPSLDVFGSLIGRIFSLDQQREYNLSPENITWARLVEPSSVKVNFGNKPKQFSVVLSYEDEIGEKVDIELIIDAERERFDWSFMEAPDDSRMQAMRNAAIADTEKILENILAQASELAAKKQAQRQVREVPVINTSSQAKLKIPGQEYVPSAKESPPKSKKTTVPVVMAMEAQKAERAGLPRIHINVPSEEELKKLFRELSEADRQKAIAALHKANEQGTSGGYKPLNTEGTPKSELRIGSESAKKGIRIILLHANSSSGVQNHDIFGAWYRGEAFKTHRKRRLNSI